MTLTHDFKVIQTVNRSTRLQSPPKHNSPTSSNTEQRGWDPCQHISLPLVVGTLAILHFVIVTTNTLNYAHNFTRFHYPHWRNQDSQAQEDMNESQAEIKI